MPDNSPFKVRPKATTNFSNASIISNPVIRIQALINDLDLELSKLNKPPPVKQFAKSNANTVHIKSKVRRPFSERHGKQSGMKSRQQSRSSTNNIKSSPQRSLNQIRSSAKSSSLNTIHVRRANSYHLRSINKISNQLKSKSNKNNCKQYLSKSLSKCSLRSTQKSVNSIARKISPNVYKSVSGYSNLSKISNVSRIIQKPTLKVQMFPKISTNMGNNRNTNFIKHTNNTNNNGQKQQSKTQPLKSSYTKTMVPTVINNRRHYTLFKNTNRKLRPSINRTRLFGGSQSKHSLGSRTRVISCLPGDFSNSDVPVKTLSSVYRSRVIEAFRNRRIFMVMGNYGTIRRALLKRGWLEKLTSNRYPRLQALTEDALLQHARNGNEYEAVAISKIINHFPAFFIWQPRGHRDLYEDVQPYRNRIRRTNALDFATKVGLIGCAEQQQWHRQEGVSRMLYPRFFRLGGSHHEQHAFIEEFHMTQCYSVLRYLCRHTDTSDLIIDYENGTIPLTILQFAYDRAKRQLDNWENVNTLDEELPTPTDAEWNDFMQNSSRLLIYHAKVKCTYRDLMEHVRKIKPLLQKLEEIRPDFKFDGCRNLWILKPGYQCRGLNIIIRNNLDDILNYANNHTSRRYIVQKYIEQPLLIYRTKFDIRQYMLLYIRESVIQIWLYRDCYLRFSSQEYSLDDLREIIHLTNNSVQKKYKTRSTRDPRLPKNNMWSLDQFKSYIAKQNVADDIWETRVYPGFKQNLIAVVLASLDETTFCENCFELYGCDFMLDEQYNPILIEINASPDLSPSTEVTAHICPMALQDLIKVIVDLPRNRNCSTGLFQLVYEINYKYKTDLNMKDTLNVHGKAMSLRKKGTFKDKFVKKSKRNESNGKQQQQQQQQQPQQQQQQQQSQQQQKTMKNAKKTAAPVKVPVKKEAPPPPTKILQKPLKAATKEALAIQYTMPK